MQYHAAFTSYVSQLSSDISNAQGRLKFKTVFNNQVNPNKDRQRNTTETSTILKKQEIKDKISQINEGNTAEQDHKAKQNRTVTERPLPERRNLSPTVQIKEEYQVEDGNPGEGQPKRPEWCRWRSNPVDGHKQEEPDGDPGHSQDGIPWRR